MNCQTDPAEEKIIKFIKKYSSIDNYRFHDFELDSMKTFNYHYRRALIDGEISKEEYLEMEKNYWHAVKIRKKLSQQAFSIFKEGMDGL